MNFRIVREVSVSLAANEPGYLFQVILSEEGMHQLKRKSLLFGCVTVEKSKYEFLNDLRDQLAEEILVHLEAMSK